MKIKAKLNVKVRQLLAASWVAAKLSLLNSHIQISYLINLSQRFFTSEGIRKKQQPCLLE